MLETFLHPIFALLSLTDSSQSLGTGSLFLLAQTPAEAAEAAEVAANNWKSFLNVGVLERFFFFPITRSTVQFPVWTVR